MKKSLIIIVLGIASCIILAVLLYSVFANKGEPSSDADRKDQETSAAGFREEDLAPNSRKAPTPSVETRSHAPAE